MKPVKIVLLLVMAAAAAIIQGCAKPQPNPPEAYYVLPQPNHLEMKPGQFRLSEHTQVSVQAGSGETDALSVATFFTELIAPATGYQLAVEVGSDGDIRLVRDKAIANPEAYRLEITPQQIVLSASDSRGFFYGIQTLRQLLPEAIERQTMQAGVDWAIPAAVIEDSPRFGYRGMHLDVGRHFFSVDFIKRYIDLIAMHKMNTFHWHLTEDQGWRIEIKQYPKLTEVGGWRNGTLMGHNSDRPRQYDNKTYGGFYTQEEVKEIVAYAAARQVAVIPEIELPGHSLAALAAYPQLACTDGPFEVAQGWGVFEDIYCPKEETFEFLQNVLLEVMALFPSKYIHIGGDEAPKTRWQESAIAQAVIEREELKDEYQLQSYFIQRIERFLNSHDRRIIGWDEILEGGLAPNATVMSWRGEEGGIAAAQQGHDVIMTPGTHCYFDKYQSLSPSEPLAIGGYIPLEAVYAYEPVPAELTTEQSAHVLGAQANLWTEYIKTPEHAEYMILPRMTALSEVLWSQPENRNWEIFLAKLESQYQRFDGLAYNYYVRYPELEGIPQQQLFLERAELSINNPITHASVYYTTDGTNPDLNSTLYTEPLEITDSTTFIVAAIDSNGKVLKQYTSAYEKSSYRQPVEVGALEPGLDAGYYEGKYKQV